MSVPCAAEFAEFAGTFVLAAAAGLCQSRSQSWVLPWVLGSMTAALTYALGPVTAGNFNPAACVGLGLLGGIKWTRVAGYTAIQVLASVLAGLATSSLYGSSIAVRPDARFSMLHAGGVEALYSFMLSFVIMNVSCSHRAASNQYFGLAIGLVYIAGGYAAAGISGGILNPAVAIGMGVSGLPHEVDGFVNALVYAGCQVVGGAAAAGAFALVQPSGAGSAAGYRQRIVCELVGAFMLVATVGLGLLSGSVAVPWSAAACLVSMTYAVGNVSGAIFNPAVSLGVALTGRSRLVDPWDGAFYGVVHLFGGCLAGALLGCYRQGQEIELLRGVSGVPAGCCTEFLFTFAFVFCYLALATVDIGFYDGIAVGLCAAAGGFATQSVVLPGHNPAVTLGVTVANAFDGGRDWSYWYVCAYLVSAELLAGVAAFGFYRLSYKDTYALRHETC